jgi:putative intracellular protease/amidase
MGKNVLIVATNQTVFPNGKARSGFWLSTVARFVNVLSKKGFDYTLVSPKGGEIFIDPHSLGWMFAKKIDWKYYRDEDFREKIKHTLSPKEIKPQNFDAIYFADGYAALTDFPENDILQAITQIIYENGGVVASIGHGISGLMNVPLSDGSYLLENKKVTGFSNFEEFLTGNRQILPYSIEDEVKQRGAKFSKSILPFAMHVVADNQVITGQTSCASGAVANEIIRVLRNVTDTLKEAQKPISVDNSLTLKPGC